MLWDPEPHDPDEEPSSPRLLKASVDLGPEKEHISAPPSPQRPPAHSGRKARQDPGLAVLIPGQADPNFYTEVLDSSSGSSGSPAMTDQAGPGHATRVGGPEADQDALIDSRLVNAKALGEKAAAALSESALGSSAEPREPAKRVDSAHDEVPQSTETKQSRSGRATPLKLQTSSTVPPVQDDSIATSPTLAKYAIPVEEGNIGTLPALQPTSPTSHGIPTSPQSERLPSFRQLTQLADAATQQENRAPQYSHHHSQSFGSAAAQSPSLPYHIPSNTQMSPNSQYTFSAARSPTSTMGDHYSSPTQMAGNPYYMERRASVFHEHPIGMPPSLPSASSSGESHGPGGSSTDGYSTNHTTPIDSAVLPDGIQRNIPILPPPRGMPPHSAAMLLSGFKCDYPGCEAAPFATQYLLRYLPPLTSRARREENH